MSFIDIFGGFLQILFPSLDRGGPSFSELISSNRASEDCKERMGWTSENVASDFNITREEQDAFAAASFIKAEAAQKNKLFSEEIVPFTVLRKEGSSGQRVPVVITDDDGIRYGTTQANLSKIKPAFPQWGNSTTTGGNASQITDGAAAILLMSRREAEKRGLRILAKHITTAVVGNIIPFLFSLKVNDVLILGVPPRIMGVGPVYAIPMALKNAGLQLGDVGLFEVSTFIYCVNVSELFNSIICR